MAQHRALIVGFTLVLLAGCGDRQSRPTDAPPPAPDLTNESQVITDDMNPIVKALAGAAIQQTPDQNQKIGYFAYSGLSSSSAIFVSPNGKEIVLESRVPVNLPNQSGQQDFCEYTVSSQFDLVPINGTSDKFLRLLPGTVKINFKWLLGPSSTGNPQNDAKLCMYQVTNRHIALNLVPIQYPSQKKLKNWIVSEFTNQIIVFGPGHEQPFPWQQNVYVAYNTHVDITDRFFRWNHGTLRSGKALDYGSLTLDPQRRTVRFSFPVHHQNFKTFCALNFEAPVTVTYSGYRAPGVVTANPYFWIPKSAIGPQQVACLKERIENLWMGEDGQHVMVGFDLPNESGLRLAFTDRYWFGTMSQNSQMPLHSHGHQHGHPPK